MSQIFIRGFDGVSDPDHGKPARRRPRPHRRSDMSTATRDDAALGQELVRQEAQAAVAVVRNQQPRVAWQRFEQAGDRRHARCERQCRFAAFERGERGFEPVLGRVALALVFVAGDALTRRAMAERRRQMDRRRDRASFGVGSAPACTASVAGCRRSSQSSVSPWQCGRPRARRRSCARFQRRRARSGHEAGFERGRRQVDAALEHGVEEAIERRACRRRSPAHRCRPFALLKNRPNMPPTRLVVNGTPASRAAASGRRRARACGASSASWKPGAWISSSIARPAAIATGLPLSVPAW